MAVPAGFDIGLDSTDASDLLGPRGFMLSEHRQFDVTPSSARRSDGDVRFQSIVSESFFSQSDFAGGGGRVYPHDPTMYNWGPGEIDGSEGNKVLPAWDWVAAFAGPSAGARILAMAPYGSGEIYMAVSDGGVGKLYSATMPTSTWTFRTNLAGDNVTSMVVFRGKIWIGYGGTGNAQVWDGTTLTTLGFQAAVLAPYLSMLFYVQYQSGTGSWRLNRYDPENPTAVADLAIMPVNNFVFDYIRSLVALGPDLFLVCMDAVYKFTSANGNSGTLTGPIDRWLPVGIRARETSGYGACVWQGSLVYPSGLAIRRHQPGGGARQIWPVPPNHGYVALDYTLGIGLHPSVLIAADDRLYIVASLIHTGAATPSHRVALYCWTGSGMHLLDDRLLTGAVAAIQYRAVGALADNGYLVGANHILGTLADGQKCGYWQILHTADAPRARQTSSTFETSILDFGLADLDKVISRIGLQCSVPSSSSFGFAVSLYVEETVGGYRRFVEYPFATRTGDYGSWGIPSMVYFTRASAPTILIGKRFVIRVTLTSTAAPTYPPELYAVTCIPNPVYPVRYGFRVTLPVGTHVLLHDGARAYADQAAVDAAVAYCRALRASSHPFVLDYVDGLSYTVRANTIAIVRDASRPNEHAWVVTMDFQEISG